MKNFWQKLTVEWPCIMGDWLWHNLVAMPRATLSRVTRHRLLHIVALVLLAIFIQQVLLFDLTFLFGLDLGLLMEVSAAVFVLSLREQAVAVVATARSALKRAIRPIRRIRAREVVTRAARILQPPRADDENGLVFV